MASAAAWAAKKPQDNLKDYLGRTIEQAPNYDWTYTPSKMFHTSRLPANGSHPVTKTERPHDENASIPYEHLRRQEPILWSSLAPIYSTELDDNGIVEFSVRVRVMPTCFFCLIRFYMRLDNVLLR